MRRYISKKMKYSEIDKIRKEAKDKYYSNNSNSAEYDEDVALAKAISLSLNIQNKPEESNVEEPKPIESNIGEHALVESNVEAPIIEEPVVEESRDEFEVPEFPCFFTVSGGMRQLDNPIYQDRWRWREEMRKEISKKERMLRDKENEMKENNRRSYAVIDGLLVSKLVKELEDLKVKYKLEMDNIPSKVLRLIGHSSPREVFPYIVINESANLETNISFFIEKHPEYFVSEMAPPPRSRSSYWTNLNYSSFMLQKL